MSKRLSIVYECSNYLVINKPPGVHSQIPDYRTHNKSNVLQYFEDDRDLRIVHRLDTNVTGGMVLAKNKNCAIQFQRYLSNKDSNKGFMLKRRYVALVQQPQLKVGSNGIFDIPVDTKPAQTKYKIADLSFDRTLQQKVQESGMNLVILELITGRKHQIREHLRAGMQTACVNDLKYESAHEVQGTRQIGLHSSWISIKVGFNTSQFCVPIIYGQDSIWRDFIDAEGHFIDGIKKQVYEF